MKHLSHSFPMSSIFYSIEDASSAEARPQLDLVILDECDKRDVDSLEQSANQNDVEAQLLLADCYYYGRGTSKSQGKRIERDVKNAFTWWSKAAELNNATAQCCLGYCYWYGEGVPDNETDNENEKSLFPGIKKRFCKVTWLRSIVWPISIFMAS